MTNRWHYNLFWPSAIRRRPHHYQRYARSHTSCSQSHGSDKSVVFRARSSNRHGRPQTQNIAQNPGHYQNVRLEDLQDGTDLMDLRRLFCTGVVSQCC